MNRLHRHLASSILMLCASVTLFAQRPEVAYFNFDGGGTPQNIAIPGQSATFSAPLVNFGYVYVPGPVGGALDLSTDVRYLQTNLNVAGSWTIEFWKVNRLTPNVGFPPLGGSWEEACFSIGAMEFREVSYPLIGRRFVFRCQDGAQSHDVVIASSSTVGTWMHVAVTYDAATKTIRSYLDGTLAQTLTATSDQFLSAPGVIRFGAIAGGVAQVWHGEIDELRIWSRVRSQQEIALNRSSPLAPLPDDLHITQLLSPTSSSGANGTTLSASESVSFRIVNYGSNPILSGTTIQASFALDLNPVITESLLVPVTLPTWGSTTLVFAATADLSESGLHRLTVSVGLSGSSPMDVSTSLIRSGTLGDIGSLPWVESFPQQLSIFTSSSLPPGWTSAPQFNAGRPRWDLMVQNGHSEISPLADSALVAGLGAGGASQATTPWIDLGTTPSPQLHFWSRRSMPWGSTMQTIAISIEDMSTAGTSTVVGGFALTAALNDWEPYSVDLSPFAGSKIRINFLFRAPGSQSVETQIDDVTVFDAALLGSGQPSRPSVALLEVERSFNGDGLRPASGDPGPYFTSTTVGDVIDFHFAGQSYQWIALFWGPLNTGIIDYGAVGRCDVGTGFDSQTGLPSGIWVIANGLSPTTFRDFLFHTGGTSNLFLSTVMPFLPPGPQGAFQAVFGQSSAPWFALSNAVELVVR